MVEKELSLEIDGYARLGELLEGEEFREFELIFIDSPPSLGMLTINGLAAAEYIVIPMRASLFSMQGTNDLLETVGKVKKTFNRELSLLGVVINMYDSVPVISREIAEEIREFFGEVLFRTVIDKSIRMEEAGASEVGVTELTGRGTEKARKEIKALCEELLERLALVSHSTGSNDDGR